MYQVARNRCIIKMSSYHCKVKGTFGIPIYVHARNRDTHFDKLCHEFSGGKTIRPRKIKEERGALVELCSQEIVDELTRLFLLVHRLVFEDEI